MNNEFESYELFKTTDDCILTRLRRLDTPLISKVELDAGTDRANTAFDFDFDGLNKFYPFEFPEILKTLDFNIIVITGASGSGKSTFSKYFGTENRPVWDNNKAIISNFDNPDDAVERLGAVGLNSIPTWCKPRNVLSVGEGFRADLARQIKSNCVIDEFTSTVDRNVALSCSKSVSKYIRNNNLKHCVFVSCHKDFIDTLCPDYVIDLDDEVIYDTRRLLRRRFELQIYEEKDKLRLWNIFKQYHYLTAEFNIASRVFVAYFEDNPIAFCSMISQPGIPGVIGGGWRIHRLVVLPDYQGLGIATKLLEYMCDIFASTDKPIYLRTSNVKLINYMLHSSKWLGNGKLEHSHQQTGVLSVYKCDTERLSASFKYIGGCSHNKEYAYDKVPFKEVESVNIKSNYEYVDLF